MSFFCSSQRQRLPPYPLVEPMQKEVSGSSLLSGQFRHSRSNMPVLEEQGAHVIIPAGTLDDDPVVHPIVHIHTASQAPWFAISDDLPQFAEYPPEEFWAKHE